jgi:NitT/TauT family transport system ATP-binding protein
MSENKSAEVEIAGLSHAFYSRQGVLHVLRDISFAVRHGEIVTILGPSGCGKSTLLRCIAGLLPIQSGKVLITGLLPARALEEKAIGFAFQDSGLLPWRTVSENILLPSELGDARRKGGDVASRLEWLLDIMKLSDFREYLPAQISGGMRQRVSLARALLLQPKLLLLDEPFGSLDLLTRTSLSVELGRVVHETSIPTIIVTHSVEEAVFLGTRVVILSELPASVVETVETKFQAPRDLSLLEHPDLLTLVGHCRSLLIRKAG